MILFILFNDFTLQKLWFDTQKIAVLSKKTCFDLAKEQLSYYPYLFCLRLVLGDEGPELPNDSGIWKQFMKRATLIQMLHEPVLEGQCYSMHFTVLYLVKGDSNWHKQDRRNSIPTLHPSMCDCMLEHQTVLDPSATAKFKNLSDFWAQTFLNHPIHPSQTILLQVYLFFGFYPKEQQLNRTLPPGMFDVLSSEKPAGGSSHDSQLAESLVSSSPECLILYIIGNLPYIYIYVYMVIYPIYPIY